MLESLRTITQEVNLAPNLSAAMNIAVERTRKAMSVKVCSLYLKDENDDFVLRASEGLNASAIGQVKMSRKEGLVGYVARRGEPINLENAQTHSRYRYFAETGEERFASFLGVPVIHQREVLGVLAIQQTERRRFSQDDEAFLVTLSAQLSAVIAHARATGDLEEYTDARSANFRGISGSQGVAIGQVVVYSPAADLSSVPYQRCEEPDKETRFFYESLGLARTEIKDLGNKLKSRLSKEEQALFDAYLTMLDDQSLAKEVVEIIDKGVAAAYAWSEVILQHAQTFSSMHDAYMRERAADIRDLGSRVLSFLQQTTETPVEYPDNTILVGDELTASVLGEVPREKLAGLVSVQGSGNSHIAILARSMGIPTVVGAVDLPYRLLNNARMIVDGYRGTAIVNPAEEIYEKYATLLEEDRLLSQSYEQLRDLPCITQDDHRVPLWVNTGLVADITRSLERGAEGVGLYRTEVPFLMRDKFPTEETQAKIYRQQLEAFAPHTVTMRTLDIGGDKALSYFPIEEDNPFLGWRGIRVTLDHPEIFLSQVRAMLRASEGLNNLRIMLPMISSVSELMDAERLISQSYHELKEDGFLIEMPPIGVMIEVPAAVYQARELAARTDFLSVGSNDLTQYLLAVDRNNPQVADLYNSYHPAVLRALQDIVRAAHSQGTTAGICGELAGDPGAAILLMAMGYDVLSMSSTHLPKVKSVIRSTSLERAERLLARVMKLSDAESVSQCVEEELRRLGHKAIPDALSED